MKKLNPYLNFPGNTREALNFYKDCLKGEIVSMQTYGEAKLQVEDKYKNNIIHAEFKADGVEFFASDGMPGFTANPGNMIAMSINLNDELEQKEIFNALAAGGRVTLPLEKTFWGATFGQLTDRFGIQWMLNCEVRE